MTPRIRQFSCVILIGFGGVLLRLADLQLAHGVQYRRLAEQNRLRVVPHPAPRGLILDRAGRHLAANRMVFRVTVIPQELGDRHETFGRLSPIVGRSVDELERAFARNRNLPFVPTILLDDVDKFVALRLAEHHRALPGIVVDAVARRNYPVGSVAAHLIGYVGQPSAEDAPALKRYGIKPQDLVGRAGLEQELDSYLRGQPGGSVIEVDHRARYIRSVGEQAPQAGQPIQLAIDAKLSARIAEQFGDQPGACVVVHPRTGELLAMVSVPAFEPSAFVDRQAPLVRRFLTDPVSPLMNRATLGTYLPGSIAKLVTAAAALEHRVIHPSTTVSCAGHLTIGDRRFHCWDRDGHGPVTLPEALMVSCNVYFMEIGRRVGLDRLRTGLMQAGFGRPTGWALGEQPGHLPFGRRFSEGEVALLAIGQGELLVTPLQMALMVSAIANGGWLQKPWVVNAIGDHPAARPGGRSLEWSDQTLAAIRVGMVAVVNDSRGTGIRAHSEQVWIAGKTGTAQTHLPGKTHAWFVGFCPAEDPVAAMAIVAEYGGSGGDLPAVIAKMICEELAKDASEW